MDREELERHLRVREESKRVRKQFEATKASIQQTWELVARVREAAPHDHELRRAKLNLLEDTELAQRREEEQAASRERAEIAERASEALVTAQKEAFQAALDGAPLRTSLDILVRAVVARFEAGTRAVFYTVDRAGAGLHPFSSAGGMEEGYLRRVAGFRVGIDSISCGLSVATGEPVLIADVEQAPGMAEWLPVAREFDFRGCWSFPIQRSAGKSLGTLALYFRQPRDATPAEVSLAETITQAAGILMSRQMEAAERREAESALRASEEQFRRAIEEAPIPVILHAEDGQVLQISKTWTAMTGYGPEDIPTFDAWLNRAYGDGADAVREQVHRLFQGEVARLETEIEVTTRHGESRCWAFSASAPGLLRDGRRFIVGMALDITERKAAERAAHHSEERVRIAVESARMGTWEWDLPEHQVTWNDQHFKLLGMTPQPNPIPDTVFFDHVHSADREWLTRHIRRAIEQHSAFESTFRIVTDQGVERWMNGYGRVTRVSGDEAVQMSGVMFDITARRQAELALRESEERLRLAQEAAEVGIWDWDLVTGASYWSETLWQLFGHAKPPPGGAIPAWKEQLVPADRRRVTDNITRLLQSQEDDFRDWFRIQRADGELRWIESIARITRDAEGTAVRMMGINIDVTERKNSEAQLAASEERLRLVVENAREYAIFSMTLDRRILSWNSGAQAILGYTAEEAFGQPGDIIFTPEDRAAGAPEREAALALAEGRSPDERWHIRKNGTRFWGSGVMMSMHNAQGEAIGLVKVFRDHTAQMKAKEALEKSREELWAALQENERVRVEVEAASRAKDHFLAVLSHELRTPLMPVLVGVRTMSRMKDLPPAARETLAMIQRNVELESHFIDDLLDVTRATRGKLEIEQEPVDVHRVIREAVEVAASDLEAKKQPLTVALEAGEHELIGDAKRLQQAVWNLLKNASKFTPEGGEIRLCTRNKRAGDGSAECFLVEVSDSGIGFEQTAADRIFEAFAQASEDITRQFGGLGLGLSIARATVEAHHGSIRAESAGEGKGATFVISLPLRPE